MERKVYVVEVSNSVMNPLQPHQVFLSCMEAERYREKHAEQYKGTTFRVTTYTPEEQ